MSSAAEDEEAAALETVKSVTLTQDSDGSIILHCPPNDDDSEPLQKKLRLSTEEQEDSDTPQFSVVTLPMSESDEGFEVTMTATADGDLSEEGVAQIQILQEDEDSLSPDQKTEVSPVSQAWFTTKEDKDTLANKGHKWKQGMWSKEEIDLLMSNIDQYVKGRGIEDPAEIIFEMSKEERKDFYRSVALGLNRPLFAVYRRVLRMYDNRNHVGKYTPDEIDKLKALREKHGNDWSTIGAALGRSASSVKDRCRLMKDTCNTGKWSEEEERRLAEVVYEMAGASPGSAVTGGVSWATVADQVRTRSEKQCRSKWLNYLNWKHSGGTEWMKEDDINLIRRISEMEVEDENEIKWEDLAGGWSSVRSPQWLRSKWWSIKRQVTNHKEIPFNVLLKGLQELMASSQTASGPGSPSSSALQIRLARLEESGGSPAPSSVAALQIPLQIPLQITHLASDSSAAASESETITLNTGALQTFEILPSFHLQPTGTPGTYYLQTTSNQGLPLSLSTSLANNSTVTLTTGSSPSSHEHIILHSLSTDGLCSGDGVIIQTVTSDPASSDPLSQSQLVVETEGRSPDDRLDATSLLEESESVGTETQEPITDDFTDKELSSPSVEGPVVHSGITSGSTVLIVSPPNISSTLTDPILENQEGCD
ncbi:cyclin-D-binding Myb-like transcription factor 1 [Sander lucioperca]|uniref:cyclin-D-binding Myb-like transcription factor 1 n=1 Tax=Sander lucioperca TaxID=283035 RepID=UPI00125D2548|nr:cyclin-D-binding Myb-like transcription factor 1 [Sander lucioperca]XP_031152793.1 cyclin-D-binding Myb-like transcription factor 1 [Sander lucioperca]XP_031152794.1 cyclin-D-binding Myb-like transcription factor 1 [Sander lucioperca]XP_035852049.1 cyclin-D-binding Myb-like transcription factor 1 [Sander lucioperca]